MECRAGRLCSTCLFRTLRDGLCTSLLFFPLLTATQNQFDDNLCSLVPYQGAMGCIVCAPRKRFFPLQLPERPGYRGILEKHIVKLPNVVVACVYEKDSLIALERRFGRFYLVEYLICRSQDNVRCIDKTGKVLMKCRRSVSKKSQITVVRTADAQMLVIMCNRDFTIDMITFTT
jgi:hypothetical protein